MAKCQNCNGEMERISKSHFSCPDCEEIFEIRGDKQVAVKDKKKLFDKVEGFYKERTGKIKDIFKKFVKFDDDGGDDDDDLIPSI